MIFSFDTGIMMSAFGLIITTSIVIFKSLNEKNEKLVTYGESIRNNVQNIDGIAKTVESLSEDSNEIKLNQSTLTTKLISISESLSSIAASNQIILSKINQHDIDVISFKKDIEYMKLDSLQKDKAIEHLKNHLEKLGNSVSL